MKNKSINDIPYIKFGLIFFMVLLLLPILFIAINSFTKNSDYLEVIIKDKILIKYIFNTLELIVKVGLFSGVIGFLGAYFITMYHFKLKWIINLLFILPLSIPVYVGAYNFTEIFYDIKFLEFLLKNDFTMNGSVFIYTIFLYPYVYLASRSYLKNNMAEYIEASETLGSNNTKTFFKIILPLSRPIIVSSSLFVIFESLSDFAVAEYYGVLTLSKAINDSWLLIAQKDTAFKLSLGLLIILFLMMSLERISRGKGKNNSLIHKQNKLKDLTVLSKVLIYLFYIIVISLGFILPFVTILSGAIKNNEYFIKNELHLVTLNSIVNVFVAIIIIILFAMFLASTLKILKKNQKNIVSNISLIGYSIPSTILALGIYTLLIKLDVSMFPILKGIGFNKYLLTGTRFALIIALTFKFLSIAFSQFENIYEKLGNDIFEASFNLSHNFTRTFLKVDFYLLRKVFKYASIILFIDLMKELTLTYSLRPFNFNTLSTEVYRYAGNEMLGVAAVPSIIIVILCAIAVLILERNFNNVKTR